MPADGKGSPAGRRPGPDDEVPPGDDLVRFAAEAGAEEAVRRLGHEAWLRLRSEEAGHLQGLLLDLAERRDRVTLLLSTGVCREGVIEVVGAGFVGLRCDDGGLCLLALASVAAVQPAPGVDLVGDRPTAPPESDLHGVLQELLSDQPTVALLVTGAALPVYGTLERLGTDMLVLRSGDGTVSYVPLQSLVELRLAPGGPAGSAPAG